MPRIGFSFIDRRNEIGEERCDAKAIRSRMGAQQEAPPGSRQRSARATLGGGSRHFCISC